MWRHEWVVVALAALAMVVLRVSGDTCSNWCPDCCASTCSGRDVGRTADCADCDDCATGYYNDGGTCTACYDCCYGCSAAGCLINDECTACNDGYEEDGTNKCACPDGTYEDGTCTACSPCCDAGGCTDGTCDTCDDCATGYYNDGGTCTACSACCDATSTCTDATCDTCVACATGYYNDSTTCTACSDCCADCSAAGCNITDECTTCNDGYEDDGTNCACPDGTYEDGTCTSCSPCCADTCTNGTCDTCDECATGYYNDTNTCTACSDCCDGCSAAGCLITVCDDCNAANGYEDDGTNCACPDGKVEASGVCTACSSCCSSTCSDTGCADCDDCAVGYSSVVCSGCGCCEDPSFDDSDTTECSSSSCEDNCCVLSKDVADNGAVIKISLAALSASSRTKRDIEDADIDLDAVLEAMADAALLAVDTQCQVADMAYSCCGFDEDTDYSGADPLTSKLCSTDPSWTTAVIVNGMVYEKPCTTVIFTYDGDNVYMTFMFALPIDSPLCVEYDNSQTIAADSYVGQDTLVDIANDDSFTNEVKGAVVSAANSQGYTISADDIVMNIAVASTDSIPGSSIPGSSAVSCHVISILLVVSTFTCLLLAGL